MIPRNPYSSLQVKAPGRPTGCRKACKRRVVSRRVDDQDRIIVEAALGLTIDDVEQVLETLDYSANCTYESTEEYEDALYFGSLDLWTNCGDSGAILLALAAVPLEVPASGDFVLRMVVSALEQRDLDPADVALGTFVVNP